MDNLNDVERIYEAYTRTRKDMSYYKYIRNLITICASSAKSILDVGSGGMDVISHCSHIPCKVSLDEQYPLSNVGGIEAIRQDFLKYEPKEDFDIVCCFQVLEHIRDVEIFCQKLLRLSRNLLIVSVPYMWETGRCKNHVQDPIDYDKLVGWFGYEPVFCNIVDERLIAVFLKDKTLRENLLKQNGREFADFDRNFLASSANAELSSGGFRERKIVLWGNGDCLARNLSKVREYYDVRFVCDNDSNKWGIYDDLGIKCVPPQTLVGVKNTFVIIMIDNAAIAIEIANQLLSMGIREYEYIHNLL